MFQISLNKGPFYAIHAILTIYEFYKKLALKWTEFFFNETFLEESSLTKRKYLC